MTHHLTNAYKTTNLQYFTHSLQFAITDGQMKTKAVKLATAKTCKLISMFHTSYTAKEAFETTFGTKVSLPLFPPNEILHYSKLCRMCCCRWCCELNSLLEGTSHEELMFTAREWSQLDELATISEPSVDTTDLTQCKIIVTISLVVAGILSL